MPPFIKFNWAPIIALSVAIMAAVVVFYYAGQPLLEHHGFRQTQTALTSYWMVHEGWALAYQTPVAGYPWSIPFEFPIYQSLAALITWLTGLPLDFVGRILSFCFLIACGWPAFGMAKRLDLPSIVAWVFCALLWSSPLYLFWGRSFMIETAAIFFTLAAIPYALDLRNSYPNIKTVLLFILFATLGLLQKVTTAAPVIIVMGFVLLVSNIRIEGFKIPSLRYSFCILAGFLIPIIIAALWISYTDFVKEQNPLGAELSSKALSVWNFGTLEQRFDIRQLKNLLWNRIFIKNAASVFGVLLLGWALYACEWRIKTILITSLILFILPILIFINLHFVHDYYQASSLVFLIGSLAIASVMSLPKLVKSKAIVPVVVILLILSNVYSFITGYGKVMKTDINHTNNTILAVADRIKRSTAPDSGLVIFGADWSSEMNYYSQRKSFTVANWFTGYNEVWNDPKKFLGDKDLGALVFCEAGDQLDFEKIMSHPLVKQTSHLFKINDCYIWLPE